MELQGRKHRNTVRHVGAPLFLIYSSSAHNHMAQQRRRPYEIEFWRDVLPDESHDIQRRLPPRRERKQWLSDRWLIGMITSDEETVYIIE